MSETHYCQTCGLPYATAYGEEQTYCNRCNEHTEYNPDGVRQLQKNDTVSHLYFDEATVISIHGTYGTGDVKSVEIRVTDSKHTTIEGQTFLIETEFLNPPSS